MGRYGEGYTTNPVLAHSLQLGPGIGSQGFSANHRPPLAGRATAIAVPESPNLHVGVQGWSLVGREIVGSEGSSLQGPSYAGKAIP